MEQLTSTDPSLRVLSERDLENYLLSDEVLRLGSDTYATHPAKAAAELIDRKMSLLKVAKYTDDVKSIAGQLFEAAKRLWRNLAQPGQDTHEFLRDICAPLIAPGTETYSALRDDLGLPEPSTTE